MSEVYSLEPPTSGKVILHTTHGEIDIELFSKECPLACRAFVQLCASKYYEQNIFHRIVKGFMVQTGDKTGTGKGNGWKEGEKFKDEFHSRISFNARGQVAMANEGKRNSNGSQFFITVDKCRHLDRKHTIFGKVANQTFYNVQRIAECECEGETPVGEPLPRIVRTEVVWNPFADIVVVAVPEEKSEEKKEQPKAKKKKQKANVGLLSFGDDEEVVEDEDERKEKKAKKQKIASAHDVVEEGSNKKFAKVDDEEYGNVLKKTEEETR
jgi:peptidyl-prolyl cis-trans isomerase SDCCAG10